MLTRAQRKQAQKGKKYCLLIFVFSLPHQAKVNLHVWLKEPIAEISLIIKEETIKFIT